MSSPRETDNNAGRRLPARYSNEPDIVLPSGVVWTPRTRLAHDVLHVNERTLARMGVETIFIAGTAFVNRDLVLAEVIKRGGRRQHPKPRKRSAR